MWSSGHLGKLGYSCRKYRRFPFKFPGSMKSSKNQDTQGRGGGDGGCREYGAEFRVFIHLTPLHIFAFYFLTLKHFSVGLGDTLLAGFVTNITSVHLCPLYGVVPFSPSLLVFLSHIRLSSRSPRRLSPQWSLIWPSWSSIILTFCTSLSHRISQPIST